MRGILPARFPLYKPNALDPGCKIKHFYLISLDGTTNILWHMTMDISKVSISLQERYTAVPDDHEYCSIQDQSVIERTLMFFGGFFC